MISVLDEKLWFPKVENALDDGLLAMGGDLCPERLLLAYSRGIFPWYDGEVPLWWSPDPRFVLYPEKIKISKSMRQVLKQQVFEYRYNAAFEDVLNGCAYAERKEAGTWINPSVIKSFIRLHKLGYAVSAEAFFENALVGGLYGILMGKVFFGESMFSKKANASKFAFITLTEQLKNAGIVIIDCQVYSNHLKTLGAEFISRKKFIEIITENAGVQNRL